MRISKKEKKLLQQAFAAPKAEKKRTFLWKLPQQEISIGQLILSQAAYIRKWVWAAAAVVLGLAVLYMECSTVKYVWGLSAFAPLLSATLMLEFTKSGNYGMAELEAASRFSLKTILFARMGIIGAVHLLGILFTAQVLWVAGTEIVWSRALYLLVPYLLTTLLDLVAVRRFQGRESTYICLGISIFASVLFPLAGNIQPIIYTERSLMLWGLAAALLFVCLGKECGRIGKELEKIWN